MEDGGFRSGGEVFNTLTEERCALRRQTSGESCVRAACLVPWRARACALSLLERPKLQAVATKQSCSYEQG